MAVQIKDWNSDRVIYRVVPEHVDDIVVKAQYEKNKIDAEVDGWTKDRLMRKAGEVPFEFLYNYSTAKGIPPTKMWEFYQEDNCREMKRLLNEFECFRCGGKLTVR